MIERRRETEMPRRAPRARRMLRVAARFTALSMLLAAGTVWTIQHRRSLEAPKLMTLPVSVVEPMKPTEEAFRIGQFLGRYTQDRGVAFRVADALVHEGHKQNISPELLVGVLLTEDPELNLTARSHVGARGLMQVMPFHGGKWGCGSNDLYDIDSNICHGVKILKQAIANAPNMRLALLRYNGCVRGRNTRDCHKYDDKVLRHLDKTQEALRVLRIPDGE
ncbi:MAG: lytic transglycosylase domain-containing protein [Gemmatimonadaceae bacterium]|nr:lytic transglycosylase domain-containing protein [Gemmatimonadaceae bacterium]